MGWYIFLLQLRTMQKATKTTIAMSRLKSKAVVKALMEPSALSWFGASDGVGVVVCVCVEVSVSIGVGPLVLAVLLFILSTKSAVCNHDVTAA